MEIERKLPLKTKFLNFFRGFLTNRFSEQLLLPWTVDKPASALAFKVVPNHYQYKEGSHREVIRRGIRYKLDISDMVDWFVYYGFLNPAHEKLFQLCKKDSIVLDIGTNIGSVLLILSSRAKDGKVIGFEPHPGNYQKCQENIRLNGQDNVEVFNLGLGDQQGKLRLKEVDQLNLGMSKMDASNEEGFVVSVTTLDRFVEDHNLTHLDLIKIDVEGFEFNIIKGGENIISRFRPKLFIELDDNNLQYQGSSAAELVTWLQEKGYQMKNADDDSPVNPEMIFKNCHFDIICLPTGS